MNFESDSTTSPLVALVEKNSNPGQHDSMPWVSSTVEVLHRSYGAGLAFRDPDNIQLEFFLPMGS